MTTLLLSHPSSLLHLTPAGHPERPDRIRAIERVLAADEFAPLLREAAPEASLEAIALAHSAAYVSAILDAAPKKVWRGSMPTR